MASCRKQNGHEYTSAGTSHRYLRNCHYLHGEYRDRHPDDFPFAEPIQRNAGWPGNGPPPHSKEDLLCHPGKKDYSSLWTSSPKPVLTPKGHLSIRRLSRRGHIEVRAPAVHLARCESFSTVSKPWPLYWRSPIASFSTPDSSRCGVAVTLAPSRQSYNVVAVQDRHRYRVAAAWT